MAGICYGCEAHISASNLEPFENLMFLAVLHFTLTNDLYSFAKELEAYRSKATPLVNIVAVIEKEATVGLPTALTVTRLMIWDIEKEFHARLKQAFNSGIYSQEQLVYATSLLEFIAGNIYHSATVSRYAKCSKAVFDSMSGHA